MEFPHLGKHCKMEFCNKLDFLPIICDACKETFCSEHYSYIQHKCEAANNKDNQAIICPVCMKVVPCVKGNEDIAVSNHIDKFCIQETKIYVNSCSYKNCKKKELVKFNCTSCKMNFCLKHRHADVHQCNGVIKQREILANAATSRCASEANQSHIQENFAKFQGGLDEDEALAKAIYESEQQQRISVGNGQSDNNNRNGKHCSIS